MFARRKGALDRGRWSPEDLARRLLATSKTRGCH